MELRTYFAILTKRWTLVVGIFLASVLVAAGATLLIPPTYEADTQLFVSTQTDAANPNQQLFQGGSFSVDRVKSYAQLATSPKVVEPVRQELGLTDSAAAIAGDVQASVPTGTVLLELRVTADNAQVAADLTNALGAELGRVIEELETPASGPPSPVKVSILKQAVPATDPISPSLPLNLAIGILAGLILGVGAALVRESLDVTIKGKEDLARVTPLPVLATVVYDAECAERPITRGDLDDIRSEAFRQLRTNLQFASVDEKPGVLVVTSALPGEGKSSVAGNLAMSLQQLGWTVCLVDGDLRRPSVATYFGLVAETGLTTALIGRVAVGDVVQSAAPGLDVVTSGGIPPNPTELVASERMTTVLRELSSRYDMVVVDAPPTLPVADAAALANRADGTLYVVQVGSTTRAQVEQALTNLEQVNANVIGVVLNKDPVRPGRGGYYDYSSTYKPQQEVTAVQPATQPAAQSGSEAPGRPTGSFRPAGPGTGPLPTGRQPQASGPLPHRVTPSRPGSVPAPVSQPLPSSPVPAEASDPSPSRGPAESEEQQRPPSSVETVPARPVMPSAAPAEPDSATRRPSPRPSPVGTSSDNAE